MDSSIESVHQSWENFCLTCMEKLDLKEVCSTFRLSQNIDLKRCVRIVVPTIVRVLDMSETLCHDCYKKVTVYADFVCIAENVMRSHRTKASIEIKKGVRTLCYTCGRVISIAPSIAEYLVRKLRTDIIAETGFDAVDFLCLDDEVHVCLLCGWNLLSFARFRKKCEKFAIAKTAQPIDKNGMVKFDDLPGRFCMRTSVWIVDDSSDDDNEWQRETIYEKLQRAENELAASKANGTNSNSMQPKPKVVPQHRVNMMTVPLMAQLNKSVKQLATKHYSQVTDARWTIAPTRYKKSALLGTRGFVLNEGDCWDVFHCGECNLNFTSSYKYGAHERHQHNVNRPFCCFICPKMFRLFKYLQYHIEDHHMDSKDRRLDDMFGDDNDTESFDCLSATGNSLSSTFLSFEATPGNLNLNMPFNESAKFLDSCKSYLFGQNEGHADTTEMDEFFTAAVQFCDAKQRLVCEICQKVLFSMNEYKVHRLQHVRARDMPFTCRKCPIFFNNRKALQTHERLHKEEKRLTKDQVAILEK